MRTIRTRAVAAAAVTLVAGLIAASPVQATAPVGPESPFVVEASSTGAAMRAVEAVGGRVDAALELVDGVAATLDTTEAAALRGTPGVRVTEDVVMRPTGARYDAMDAALQVEAMNPGTHWNPNAGAGVAVALIDTGVTPSPELSPHRVVQGANFSNEAGDADSFGHGTFMAGLIAAAPVANTPVANIPGAGTNSIGGANTPSVTEAHGPVGVAPAATVVSVKVAGRDGTTRLSKVLRGMGWVAVNRDRHQIRVVNLSFGVEAPMPYLQNPLSGAAEALWAAGITVVVAAGNDGGTVTSPGDDPWVLTVGSTDPNGTPAPGDDTVPSWSGTKSFGGYAKPEVVAPGVTTYSLRVPGSTIDRANPSARIAGRYFKGSGTSMSTALVAGAAAVVVQHHPAATPDDVKGALVSSAAALPGSAAKAVDIGAAVAAEADPAWWQTHPIAFDGLGLGLVNRMPWTAASWSAASWSAASWSAASWSAASWSAASWSAASWSAASWSAASWSAASWSAASWSAASWSAASWSSARWA